MHRKQQISSESESLKKKWPTCMNAPVHKLQLNFIGSPKYTFAKKPVISKTTQGSTEQETL